MKKSLIFGVLAAFAISAVSVQNINAQNPVKTNKTEAKAEKKADVKAAPVKVEKKADKPAKASAAPKNKIRKQSKKDVKPAQTSTASDCCKSNNTNCDNTSKKKLSGTNGSNQSNAAVKPQLQTQSQQDNANNANDK